jgi:hypothetical protein
MGRTIGIPRSEPEHTAPRPSSPGPCRFPTKAICCRIFTPALPDYPAASLRDLCSGAYTCTGMYSYYEKWAGKKRFQAGQSRGGKKKANAGLCGFCHR